MNSISKNVLAFPVQLPAVPPPREDDHFHPAICLLILLAGVSSCWAAFICLVRLI